MITPNLNKLLYASPFPEVELVVRRIAEDKWRVQVVSRVTGPTTAPRQVQIYDPATGDQPLLAVAPTLEDAMAQLEALCDPTPPRWAFWTYDHFPFMLGGKIADGPDERGFVATHEYGKHNWFKPFAILTGTKGESLESNLNTIHGEYREAEKKLGVEFRTRWRDELRRKGVTHPNEARWGCHD